MQNKIGYHVHPRMTYQREWSQAEKDYFWDHVQKAQPTGLLFLDDIDAARTAKRVLPNSHIVFRRWDITDGAWHNLKTPQQTYDMLAQYGEGGIILNVMNEPHGYVTDPKNDPDHLRRLAHYMAECYEIFGKAGIAIAGPNFGEGHPDIDNLDDLDEMWAAQAAWRHLHFHAIHEYGTWRGLLFNEPNGKYNVFPWRIGRDRNFVLPYLKAKGYAPANRLVLEFGCDAAHDGTAHRGWKTRWEKDELGYFRELQAARHQVYDLDLYKALIHFSWGNTGRQFSEADWVTHDISQAFAIHRELEKYAQTPDPTPAPEPEPIPTPPAEPPIVVVTPPKWRSHFDERQLATIDHCVQYAKNPFGDIGHNLKLIVAKFADLAD